MRRIVNALKGRNSEWAKKDTQESQDIHNELVMDKKYQKIMHSIQHSQELKKQYRERRAEREARIQPQLAEESKLVLHSQKPVQEVALPKDDQMFAVLRIAGIQYKVSKDDLIVAEKLPYEVGTQVVFDSVLLVGTPMYTEIGRPIVQSAKVYASVEEQTLSEKVLSFKKKRRKGYKRMKGHRQDITTLKVDKIEHEPSTKASLFLPVNQ